MFKTAQDLNMKFGMKVGIIKCHHFAKFEQNRAKCMAFKRKKLNFGENAKNWLYTKPTRVGLLFQKV